MVACRVTSYAEEIVHIIDETGEVHQKYNKIQGRVCHHILFKKNYIITCMKKVYLREKHLKIIILLS